ncbi:Scr1 family TA system antitoxin-like transcriptional regulator [Streptomyces sp. NPDC057638]|uniref:helix-turn-helix domain-containing protein n=1 Tax=Streptomyces sp. NPDC057638 TaxID=3346190 RepID=UPI003682A661
MVNRKELNPDRSPREKFGLLVRGLRDERGWTQEELARRLGCTGAHVSAVETGRRPATQQFAKALDRVFGLGDRLERQSKAGLQTSLLDGFSTYLSHEARAAEIRWFESGVIPGPLQTREYAQELAQGAVERDDITPEQAVDRVDVLIRRQAALVRAPAPLIFAVLDESCIRRQVGGSEIMRAQFDRLLEFARMSSTTLQVAPFTMGARKPLVRMVSLLTLPDRSLVSWEESQTHGYLDRELSSVLPLVKNYHQLQAEAASQAESVAMIEQLRKGTL